PAQASQRGAAALQGMARHALPAARRPRDQPGQAIARGTRERPELPYAYERLAKLRRADQRALRARLQAPRPESRGHAHGSSRRPRLPPLPPAAKLRPARPLLTY